MGRKYEVFRRRTSGVRSQHRAYDCCAARRYPAQDRTFSILLHLRGMAFLFEPSAWPVVDATHHGLVPPSLELPGAITVALRHTASGGSPHVGRGARRSSRRSTSSCEGAPGGHYQFPLQLSCTIDDVDWRAGRMEIAARIPAPAR